MSFQGLVHVAHLEDLFKAKRQTLNFSSFALLSSAGEIWGLVLFQGVPINYEGFNFYWHPGLTVDPIYILIICILNKYIHTFICFPNIYIYFF